MLISLPVYHYWLVVVSCGPGKSQLKWTCSWAAAYLNATLFTGFYVVKANGLHINKGHMNFLLRGLREFSLNMLNLELCFMNYLSKLGQTHCGPVCGHRDESGSECGSKQFCFFKWWIILIFTLQFTLYFGYFLHLALSCWLRPSVMHYFCYDITCIGKNKCVTEKLWDFLLFSFSCRIYSLNAESFFV